MNRLRQKFKNDDLGPKMPNFPNFTNSKNFQSARYFCVMSPTLCKNSEKGDGSILRERCYRRTELNSSDSPTELGVEKDNKQNLLTLSIH